MNQIINLDDYRESATLVINTGQDVHVYPVAYFKALIAGDDVAPLPDVVLRAIVAEWLEQTVADAARGE